MTVVRESGFSTVQFWSQGAPPTDVQVLMSGWKGWSGDSYQLFGQDSAYEFINSRLGQRVSEAFSRCTQAAAQADLFRYCFLYVLGGLWVDADILLRNPHFELQIKQSDGLLLHRQGRIANDFIFVRDANHPLMSFAIAEAVTRIEHIDKRDVWNTTGPGILNDAFHSRAGSLLFANFDTSEFRSYITDFQNIEDLSYRGTSSDWKSSHDHWGSVNRQSIRRILHVGMPKTGTSVIQHVASMRSTRENKYFSYPQSGRSGVAHHKLAKVLRHGVKENRQIQIAELQNEIRLAEHSEAQIIFLSSEQFMDMLLSQPEQIEDFCLQVGITEVVLLLRTIADFSISMYQQQVRVGSFSGDFSEYIKSRTRYFENLVSGVERAKSVIGIRLNVVNFTSKFALVPFWRKTLDFLPGEIESLWRLVPQTQATSGTAVQLFRNLKFLEQQLDFRINRARLLDSVRSIEKTMDNKLPFYPDEAGYKELSRLLRHLRSSLPDSSTSQFLLRVRDSTLVGSESLTLEYVDEWIERIKSLRSYLELK